jgi:hypothetical protein
MSGSLSLDLEMDVLFLSRREHVRGQVIVVDTLHDDRDDERRRQRNRAKIAGIGDPGTIHPGHAPEPPARSIWSICFRPTSAPGWARVGESVILTRS